MKPFNNIAVSPTEPENKADVWIKHNKNLYKCQSLQNGLWIGGSNDIVSNSSGWYIIIPIKGGLSYTISKKNTKAENSYISLGIVTTTDYPKNGVHGVDTWISNSSSKKITIQTSTNANYLFLGLAAGNISQVTEEVQKLALEELQVEVGTEATEYEAPIENDIKVKDNGVYNSILPEVERFSLEGYQTDLIKTVNRSMLYKEGNKVTIFVYLTMNEITSTSTVNIFKALPERFRPQEELVSFPVGKSDATNSAFTFGALRKDGTIDLAQNPKMASGTNIIFNFSYYV